MQRLAMNLMDQFFCKPFTAGWVYRSLPLYPAVASHHSLCIGFQVELFANLRVAGSFFVSPLDSLNPPTTYVLYFFCKQGPKFILFILAVMNESLDPCADS